MDVRLVRQCCLLTWHDAVPQEDAARLEESMKEMMEEEMDEDQLIEQRRKERQAIMAKHQQAGGHSPAFFHKSLATWPISSIAKSIQDVCI